MARISEDDDSWKAGGVKRRDFRHTHNGPEVPRHGKKKNTKKWCRGQVGKLHEYVTTMWKKYENYLVDKCINCGKEDNWRRKN